MTGDAPDAPVTVLADGRRVTPHELLPLVYDDLRRVAGAFFRRERASHTLQPTALVHEAYLRLADQQDGEWRNRAHFVGVAAQAMRRVLVDAARARRSGKRGGGLRPVTLVESLDGGEGAKVDVVDLEEALAKLENLNPRYGRIVELRFFGGLTIKETAALLGVSTTIVERNWAEAKGWLSYLLGGEAPPTS